MVAAFQRRSFNKNMFARSPRGIRTEACTGAGPSPRGQAAPKSSERALSAHPFVLGQAAQHLPYGRCTDRPLEPRLSEGEANQPTSRGHLVPRLSSWGGGRRDRRHDGHPRDISARVIRRVRPERAGTAGPATEGGRGGGSIRGRQGEGTARVAGAVPAQPPARRPAGQPASRMEPWRVRDRDGGVVEVPYDSAYVRHVRLLR